MQHAVERAGGLPLLVDMARNRRLAPTVLDQLIRTLTIFVMNGTLEPSMSIWFLIEYLGDMRVKLKALGCQDVARQIKAREPTWDCAEILVSLLSKS